MGPISQTHIGHFKPRASKKKQKRTLYFAIIVFKGPESVTKLFGANTSQYLQGRVNKQAEKNLRFTENPFLAKAKVDFIASEDDEPETAEERQKRLDREQMEAEGFQLVTPEAHSNRIKGRNGTVSVKGVKAEEAREYYEKQQAKKIDTPGYVTGKERKEKVKSDFYMFQKRLAQKDSLETLKAGFEADKKRLQKALDKQARRENKLAQA